MGRRATTKSHTLPSSPTHSSSSSFEFMTISLSPRKSADELFYKGQILPLHLSPRLSLLLSSSRDSTATTSRDSSASSSSSSNSSSELKHLTTNTNNNKKPSKYSSFSLSKFSSVFRKEQRRVSTSAKEVITKYLKKVKPLYEKLSQKQQKVSANANSNMGFSSENAETIVSHSFSGNLRYPVRRRSCVSSCPSSMGSSPSHGKNGSGSTQMGRVGGSVSYSDSSSMEELQNAIQGAIAHCKSSMMMQSKSTMVSNEI